MINIFYPLQTSDAGGANVDFMIGMQRSFQFSPVVRHKLTEFQKTILTHLNLSLVEICKKFHRLKIFILQMRMDFSYQIWYFVVLY